MFGLDKDTTNAIFTLLGILIGSVPGTIALWRSFSKQALDEAAVVKTVSLDLIKPLQDRIQSLEAEKVNWHLERAILVRQVIDRDGVISDLRSITSKLLGGITALISQLHENGFKPNFELSEEILESLKKHVTTKQG